ncbi:MAG: beta-galactosidase [Oscillospiraceae bacterium]|jgi:beta-galactosidase/beta-glucuronidase|nr:beta-galactosidase [Oscillospiraceae bacterium]
MNIPRAEHPNPQFMREQWLCLNGEWQFEIDTGKSGMARKLYKREAGLSGKITVPFCPESRLSGVEYKDFMHCVWYRRTLELTEAQRSGRLLLHFGAVDYEAIVYVNGFEAGRHKGGYVSFAVDITKLAVTGTNILTVCAVDDTRDPLVPRGKQSEEFYSHGCDYTRTTGIWQSVWLEFVPDIHIKSVKYYPDVESASLTIHADLCGGGTLRAEAFYEGKSAGSAEVHANGGFASLYLPLSETHLWEVGNGRLYDLKFTFANDTVNSYFGLRSIGFDGMKFLLNGKSVFQRLVLDQGFYPDGIYTAPADADLLGDILLSKAVGFNGARLHEKVFEPRFLYHADREGYLVWGEFPNWGLDHTRADAVYGILPEWTEEINRDFNHPSIIGWCPFNETWDLHHTRQNDEVLRIVYRATKAVDPTRPCIDTSGNFHVETDIFDLHDYDQNPETFRARYEPLMREGEFNITFPDRHQYEGQPTFISEYGGIQWSVVNDGGWGYGSAPKSGEEFIERYRGLTNALLDNDKMFGFCYTQLTDIEQEQNGLYTYDRKPKFDSAIFHEINSRKAAIED